jgi:potassium/hydrogen antiporter
MEATVESVFIAISILLVLSVAASKISSRFGVPSLLLFLILGMVAGSEGIGGIYFDNAAVAQAVGLFALVIILFVGGLNAEWKEIRNVVQAGLALATVGVLLTALIVGIIAHLILGSSMLEGLLLGAIVSSTDAAAVFSLLPSQGIRLKGRLAPLLEFESGSNDPMAVFLTVGLIQLIQTPALPPLNFLFMFLLQMAIGAAAGLGAGKLLIYIINRLHLGNSGLYPVLALGMLLLTFGATSLIHGSGVLAVYLVGLVLGRVGLFTNTACSISLTTWLGY